jgi:tRNA(Ile2) C34 agmatinyltransferase TiaS
MMKTRGDREREKFGVTRQRLWQIRKQAEKKCPVCGKKTEGGFYCDGCADKINAHTQAVRNGK